MSLDIRLSTSRGATVSFDDDGYYWFIHPLIEDLRIKTGPVYRSLWRGNIYRQVARSASRNIDRRYTDGRRYARSLGGADRFFNRLVSQANATDSDLWDCSQIGFSTAVAILSRTGRYCGCEQGHSRLRRRLRSHGRMPPRSSARIRIRPTSRSSDFVSGLATSCGIADLPVVRWSICDFSIVTSFPSGVISFNSFASSDLRMPAIWRPSSRASTTVSKPLAITLFGSTIDSKRYSRVSRRRF